MWFWDGWWCLYCSLGYIIWSPFIAFPLGICTVLGSSHPLSLIFLTNLQDWYHYSSFRAKHSKTLRVSVSGPKVAARNQGTISLHQVYLNSQLMGHTGLDSWVLMCLVLHPKVPRSSAASFGGVEPGNSAKSSPYLEVTGRHWISVFLNLHGPVGNGSNSWFSGWMLPHRTVQLIMSTQTWWVFKICGDTFLTLHILSLKFCSKEILRMYPRGWVGVGWVLAWKWRPSFLFFWATYLSSLCLVVAVLKWRWEYNLKWYFTYFSLKLFNKILELNLKK